MAGIKKATLLNDKRTVITIDIDDNVSMYDIIKCTKLENLGKVDFEEVILKHNPQQWVANWCTIDTKSGDITVHIDEGKCLEAEIYYEDVKSNSVDFVKYEDQRITVCHWILTNMFFDFLKRLMPLNISFARKQLHLSVDTNTSVDQPRINDLKTPSLQLAITSPWQTELSMTSPQIDSKPIITSPSEDFMNREDSESDGSKSRSSSPNKPNQTTKSQSFIGKFKFKKSKSQKTDMLLPNQTESMVSVTSQLSNPATESLPPLPSIVSRKIVSEFVSLIN